jgi:hypothetical protein
MIKTNLQSGVLVSLVGLGLAGLRVPAMEFVSERCQPGTPSLNRGTIDLLIRDGKHWNRPILVLGELARKGLSLNMIFLITSGRKQVY